MEQEKLYSPVNFFLRDKTAAFEGQYDDVYYWRDEITHEDAFTNMAEIKAALADDRQRYDNGRGLAEYLREGPLNDKVQSLVPHIELHGDQLWTVAHLQLNEPLTPMEMADLKSWWGGQLSDGWGEGLEQQEIIVDEGTLYIEPWSSSAGFFIATQDEFDRRMGIERPAPDIIPKAEPTPDLDAQKRELFSRLDKNLSDFCEAIVDTDKRELIGMSEEIATRFGVRDYLKNHHQFKEMELDFLLQFKSPLTVVSEHTPPIPMLLDMSGAISELVNLDGALRREYPMEKQYADIQDSFDDRDDLLTQIAQKHCRVETLEERKSDSLDFHEVSVWGLKAALQEAFEAGAAHQMACAAVVEMPAPKVSVVDEQSLRDTLEARLEENFADMMNDLRSDITAPGISQKDMVKLADRITSVSAAHDYINNDYKLNADQVEYLLQFQNPLEVIADSWPQDWSGLMDMSYLVEDIFDRQDALQGDYPLMVDAPPTVQEGSREPTSGKPSLLAGLRDAKVKSDQQKNTPPTNKSGPEL